jgi:phage replication-related protein YjqB (UPF0714/DUF867 family)
MWPMGSTTFAELLAMPGVVEELELRSRFGFMAYHGGALEEMTDVIAKQAAQRSGASYYAVTQPESLLIHLPSISVTPDQSPAMAAFLDHVEIVVTVHGFGRRQMMTSILLGGRNRHLAGHVATHLRRALPVYDVVDELARIPTELQGVHDRNPVNAPRLGGVQIELPPRVRGTSAVWWDLDADTNPHTAALIEALAHAATTWETYD